MITDFYSLDQTLVEKLERCEITKPYLTIQYMGDKTICSLFGIPEGGIIPLIVSSFSSSEFPSCCGACVLNGITYYPIFHDKKMMEREEIIGDILFDIFQCLRSSYSRGIYITNPNQTFVLGIAKRKQWVGVCDFINKNTSRNLTIWTFPIMYVRNLIAFTKRETTKE